MNNDRDSNGPGKDRKRLRFRGLNSALRFIDRAEGPIILALAIASGYYTFRGALALNADISVAGIDWNTKEHALVISVSVTLALFFILATMMKVFPELDFIRLNLFAWPLLALIVVTVLGISSYFNLAGMIGDSALLDDMQDRLPGIVRAVNRVVSQVEADETYVEDLQNLATLYSAQAELELRQGTLSGQRNGGPVSGSLLLVAQAFTSAATTAKTDHDATMQIARSFQGDIDRMSSAVLPYQPESIRQRQREFYQSAERIRSGVVRIVKIDILEEVRRAFTNAHRDESNIRNTQYQISPQQLNAMIGIYQALDSRQREYLPDGVVQERKQDRDALMSSMDTPLGVPSVYIATWQYKFNYVPFLVAAMLLDTAIIPVMLMKMLARWQLSSDSADLSVLDRISAADLRTIQEAMPRRGSRPSGPESQGDVPERGPEWW